MSLRDLLFGRPLASHEEGEQRVGPVAGIPMLGLDALSSAAYGPEAAMTLLIPLGAQVGIDPIQFGAVVVLNLMIGLMHPPIGLLLFVSAMMYMIHEVNSGNVVLPGGVGGG